MGESEVMSKEIKNARIGSTMLGVEDHGILTAFLYLDYDSSSQGFGGYSLDGFNKELDKRVGSAYGMEFIKRVLNVLEVDNWENLKGKYCRADSEHYKVHGIGHITKDQWFYPEKDLKFLVKN